MPAASFAAVPEGVSTKKVVELKYDGFTEYGTNEDGSAYTADQQATDASQAISFAR